MLRRLPGAWIAGTLVCVAMLSPVVPGWAVTISPVQVDLTRQKPVMSITVNNPSSESITFQSRLRSWRQVNGQDEYDETNDLVVVPPMAILPAGRSQIFRVAMRRPQAPSVEQAYRLILENIPDESAEAVAKRAGTIVVHISHDLPVLVAPAVKVGVVPRLSTCSAPAGKICVRLENAGNVSVRMRALSIGTGDASVSIKVFGAILAGAWKQWVFDRPPGMAGPLKLGADTSVGFVSSVISSP